MSYVLSLHYTPYGRPEVVIMGVFSDLELAQDAVHDLIPVKWHWSEQWHTPGSEPIAWESSHNGFGAYIKWGIHYFWEDVLSELPEELVKYLRPEDYPKYQK